MLGLRAGLGLAPGLWIAHEVLDDAGIGLLVGGGVRGGAIIDPDDLGQAGVAVGAAEVLAALLLDLGAARVGVTALATSTGGEQRGDEDEGPP